MNRLEPQPSRKDIEKTVEYICGAYRMGRISRSHFEYIIGRLLALQVENAVENKLEKWLNKATDKYLEAILEKGSEARR